MLPAFVKPFSEYLRAAGYYIARSNLKSRPAGSPFFWWTRIDAVNPARIRLRGERKNPAELPFPPQFEDTEETRRDWANYYESLSLLDRQFAARLNAVPEGEPTIVIFFSEYGFTLREGNSAAYESGTRVPLLIRLPDAEAKVDTQPVMLLDVAPTLLNLAGVDVPGHMQGRAFLGARLSPPRRVVFAMCDRPDNRYELVRSVRDARHRYVRNFTKGTEELFETATDPWEVKNIAESEKATTSRLKDRWERWRDETHDLGLLPEAEVAAREAALGTRYAIGRQPGYEALLRRLTEVAGEKDESRIREASSDEDAAVRAWACSNVSDGVLLKRLLSDASGAVRVTAARGLRKISSSDAVALRVLVRSLRSPEEWVRMLAALALEGERDAEVIAALQTTAKTDKNSTVAAVARRAIKGTP